MNKKINFEVNLPRILHFVPGFRLGGIESLLMSLYRSLDKSTMQFDFIVDTLDNLPEFDEIRTAGGRVFQMGRYLDNPVKYQINIEKLLKIHGQEYIALHCHSIIRALPVLLSAKRHGISKRILHSHTDSLQGSKQALIATPIATVTSLFATDYWACSKAAGRFFFGTRPYKVFNNAIRTSQFEYNQEDRDRIRKIFNIEQNSLVVGHTGRFTYQKNHTWLIQVFAEIYNQRPEARLLLVGEGPLESEMQSLVNKLDLTEAVFFVGLQTDIASYLSAMDLFFLPSHFEGFCISLLEAQANGLPCLAADVIPKEVQITPSVVTYSFQSNANEWANRILKLHEEGRVESKKNICLIQQAGYDTDIQINSLLSMYNKLSTKK